MKTIDEIMLLVDAACDAEAENNYQRIEGWNDKTIQAAEDESVKARAAVVAALLDMAKDAEWQPIETAPHETLIFIGRFIDGVWKFGKSEMFYEEANPFEGETFNGWVWSEDEVCIQEPTHWMPLPAAPKETK